MFHPEYESDSPTIEAAQCGFMLNNSSHDFLNQSLGKYEYDPSFNLVNAHVSLNVMQKSKGT